jgi:hypothetical protein
MTKKESAQKFFDALELIKTTNSTDPRAQSQLDKIIVKTFEDYRNSHKLSEAMDLFDSMNHLHLKYDIIDNRIKSRAAE